MRAHTHVSHIRWHVGCGRAWLRWSSGCFPPSVSALQHTSSTTHLTLQSHTHTTKHPSNPLTHFSEFVEGPTCHTSSHWQHVCRVCNGPTGELILLTSRVRNISSPPREQGDQGQLNTQKHTHYWHVNTYTGLDSHTWRTVAWQKGQHETDLLDHETKIHLCLCVCVWVNDTLSSLINTHITCVFITSFIINIANTSCPAGTTRIQMQYNTHTVHFIVLNIFCCCIKL